MGAYVSLAHQGGRGEALGVGAALVLDRAGPTTASGPSSLKRGGLRAAHWCCHVILTRSRISSGASSFCALLGLFSKTGKLRPQQMEPKLCVTLGRCLFSDRIAVLKLDREFHENVRILCFRWTAGLVPCLGFGAAGGWLWGRLRRRLGRKRWGAALDCRCAV